VSAQQDETAKRLQKALKSFLVENPEYAKEFLQTVCDSLTVYKEKIDNYRSTIAQNICNQVLSLGIIKSRKAVLMLELFFISFPLGETNLSPRERGMWEIFVKKCQEENITSKFIQETRGVSFANWYYTYVIPCFAKYKWIECDLEEETQFNAGK